MKGVNGWRGKCGFKELLRILEGISEGAGFVNEGDGGLGNRGAVWAEASQLSALSESGEIGIAR